MVRVCFKWLQAVEGSDFCSEVRQPYFRDFVFVVPCGFGIQGHPKDHTETYTPLFFGARHRASSPEHLVTWGFDVLRAWSNAEEISTRIYETDGNHEPRSDDVTQIWAKAWELLNHDRPWCISLRVKFALDSRRILAPTLLRTGAGGEGEGKHKPTGLGGVGIPVFG